MENLQSLMNHLEACMRDHVEAQNRMIALLQEQERSVLEERPPGVELATQALTAELRTVPERTQRRDKILARFALAWGVANGSLTLSSVADRYGEGSQRLRELRDELREATAQCMRLNRRVSSLVRLHRRVMLDVIDSLLADEENSPMKETGTLLNAQA